MKLRTPLQIESGEALSFVPGGILGVKKSLPLHHGSLNENLPLFRILREKKKSRPFGRLPTRHPTRSPASHRAINSSQHLTHGFNRLIPHVRNPERLPLQLPITAINDETLLLEFH